MTTKFARNLALIGTFTSLGLQGTSAALARTSNTDGCTDETCLDCCDAAFAACVDGLIEETECWTLNYSWCVNFQHYSPDVCASYAFSECAPSYADWAIDICSGVAAGCAYVDPESYGCFN